MSTPMQDDILATVNGQLKAFMYLMVEASKAAADGKISGSEWVRLGAQGSQLALGLLLVAQDMTAEERKALPYVGAHTHLEFDAGA